MGKPKRQKKNLQPNHNNLDPSSNAEKLLSIQREVTSSPIPPPEMLQGYEDIDPGLGKQIIEWVIGQTNHRRKIEDKLVTADIDHEKMGMKMGFIIAVLGMAGTVYLIVNDYSVAGSILGGAVLTGLVTNFLTSRSDRAKQDKTDHNK